MADIADKASGVWTNVSWVTGGNQDSKAMKHSVFKAPISFRKRLFCPVRNNIWPKWTILGGQTALAKLFLSCQTSGVLQVLLMLKTFCLD